MYWKQNDLVNSKTKYFKYYTYYEISHRQPAIDFCKITLNIIIICISDSFISGSGGGGGNVPYIKKTRILLDVFKLNITLIKYVKILMITLFKYQGGTKPTS